MLIGCIADDFTGASDLGNMLARSGMTTSLCMGVPSDGTQVGTDAAVVALKSRSIPADQAIRQALDALTWLRAQGCRQFYFKYCSTFDSTPEGNIGPVLDALGDALAARRVVVVPAFPGTGRRVFMGHLFVDDQLLNRSGMEDHPLTPMIEPDIRRWLGLQTRHRVGHVDSVTVRNGSLAIRTALEKAQAHGARYVVIDTTDDADLEEIGAAVADDVLVSGGSGLGLGLPQNFPGKAEDANRDWKGRSGRAVALAGSCSRATQGQVSRHAQTQPVFRIDPLALAAGTCTLAEVIDWVSAQPATSIPMVTSTMSGDDLDRVQTQLGKERSAALLETFFGDLAMALVAEGFERLIVGGGETSGSVVSALNMSRAVIGPQIAPGVPALLPVDTPIVCTLKSGNFGDEHFFAKAAKILADGIE